MRLALADGAERWKLSLADDPASRLPGMAYSTPLLGAGRLYVTLSNLTGPHVGQPGGVVCIGDPSAAIAAAETRFIRFRELHDIFAIGPLPLLPLWPEWVWCLR